MSSATDTAAIPPSTPAPSVFISYASEDRVAARTLRDTLSAAGLDVWYDENELTGGDSWDQKIRRQIRDCEYFMPVISATTEARKEGYFRREWRLAVERSLDMADDVLFLVPIAIDDTREAGARVPDKFLTVQWLRAPGGSATPAFHHLIRRILSGNHHALTRPPMSMARPPVAYQQTTAPFSSTPPIIEPPPLIPPAAASSSEPPPMPAFPHVPEKGGFLHGIKFLAEAFWWALTAAWMLFKRLPRWGRILATIWIVGTLFSARSCNRINIGRNAEPPDPPDPVLSVAAKKTADDFSQAVRETRKNGNPADLAHLGEQIAARFAPDAAAAGKRLVLVPFARLNSEVPDDKFANAVFETLYGRLTLTHGRDVGLFRQLPPGATDAILIARAKTLGSSFVLTAHFAGEGDARALTVSLLEVENGGVKWTDSFPVTTAESTAVAEKIANTVSSVLPAPPKREFPRPKQ